MTICNKCEGYVPDLGGHNCPVTTMPSPSSIPPFPYVPPKPYGQKCDLCGSTAIDHTEIQCQLNRVSKTKRTLNK